MKKINIIIWSGIKADKLILFSFLFSGCAALIYQVSWQRALYGLIGVDMDSITIIVSVFMLGIGLGGMLGGWLSDRYPLQRLRWYAGIELSIALYGAASLWLLQVLQNWLEGSFLGSGAVGSAVASFIFLLLPTVLMGMTLPLLTMAFNERRANIGVSVGTLYFINTLGAAIGAALVPFVLLPLWTLPQVIHIAVAGNVAVVLCAVLAARLLPRAGGATGAPATTGASA
jgi:predicted membrane-bound spermidine synthase